MNYNRVKFYQIHRHGFRSMALVVWTNKSQNISFKLSHTLEVSFERSIGHRVLRQLKGLFMNYDNVKFYRISIHGFWSMALVV
jgi:hypothetical protein